MFFAPEVYTVFGFYWCFVLLWHWQWRTHMIGPVPMKQPWRIWVNASRETYMCRNWKYYFNKLTTPSKNRVCVFVIESTMTITVQYETIISVQPICLQKRTICEWSRNKFSLESHLVDVLAPSHSRWLPAVFSDPPGIIKSTVTQVQSEVYRVVYSMFGTQFLYKHCELIFFL